MFDTFFISSVIPSKTLHGFYDPVYVWLSLFAAALIAYIELAITRRLIHPKATDRKMLITWCGALAIGAGIWSMHFIGLLAYRMDIFMDYDPWLTATSLFVAIATAFGILSIVNRPGLGPFQMFAGSILLGVGLSAMHYTGTLAMIVNAELRYRPGLFAAFIAIAILACWMALWIAYRFAHYTGRYPHLIQAAASLLIAAGLGGMHYTGMAAIVFMPHEIMPVQAAGVSLRALSLGTSLLGFVLCIVLPMAVYRPMHDDGTGDESASAFPTKLLTLAVLGTFIVLLWTCGYSFYSGHIFATALAHQDDMQRFSRRFYYIAAETLLFAAALMGTWLFALRGIRLWRSELRNNRTILRTILDNMPLALFAKDAANDYRWLLLNRKAEEMFCLRHEDVVGHPDGEFFPSEEAAFFRRTDERVMAEGKLIDIEEEPVTTPLGTFIAHTIKVPIYDMHGKPHILLGMTEDVTDRARAKEELRIAKNKAEESDRAKSEFLANMSHELRTPLNSILGTIRLLQESSINVDQREMIETVFASSTNLLEIVNDTLDLSKIEAGALQLEHIGFDPDYVLDSVIDRMQPLAREKRLRLQKTENPRPPYVVGDPTRLGRILTNLISNAVKYTQRGSVRVNATYREIGFNRVLYRCEVIDTGIGVSPDKHQSIFEKFTQADSSTTRKYGGTGLGLAITKQLVELMGGTIGLESEAGHGATFWFEIAFTVTDTLYREKDGQLYFERFSAIPPGEARILIAEDHPMNQTLIRRLMTRFKIGHFTIVSNGNEALEACKMERWDLILMDCHMPEKNGYDTSLDIRRHERTAGGHVPIIAMTANAMVGDREKCLRCGMDDYISKPLVIEKLQRIMAQWIDLPVDTQAKLPAAPAAAPSVIDLTQMREFSDGDLEIARELIQNFIQQSDQNLAAMTAHCIDGASPAWVEAAHMFKGGAAGIGAAELQTLCAAAQAMKDSLLSERQSLLLQIEAAYYKVKQALKSEGLYN